MTRISVTIKPNSKHREEVVVDDDDTLTVFTKAPAVEGKANDTAIQLLAKYYGVSKRNVKLIRGHTSKHKIFDIDD